MRRRARFLRRARELAYRDLGGLVFELHRFGQQNDPLVSAKLTMLDRIDRELRALEDALRERREVTVLHEAGIAACPRCAAIHSSADRFCPACGLSMSRQAQRPIAGAPLPLHHPPAAPAPGPAAAPAPGLAGAPAPATATAAAPAAAPAPATPAAQPQAPQEPSPPAQQAAEGPAVEQGEAAPDVSDAEPPRPSARRSRSTRSRKAAKPAEEQPAAGGGSEQPAAEERDQPTEILQPPAPER